jgi:hypothetical protein
MYLYIDAETLKVNNMWLKTCTVVGSAISIIGAGVDYVQHPLTADTEAAAIVSASTSNNAATVVAPIIAHPILDGVEFAVIPPDGWHVASQAGFREWPFCLRWSLLRNHVLWLRFAAQDNRAAFDKFRLR